jgi:protein-L-isoaspartate(D-aspartate) O-methyltransferase
VQRSVAFEAEDGHWTSRSVVPCGFMRLRGSLAGPERTYVLSRADELSITVHDGVAVDPAAMSAALGGPSSVRSTDVVAGPEQLLTDLGLWLAVHERRWCALSEKGGQRLPSALTVQGTTFTAGVRDAEGVAVLSGVPDGALVVYGYGASGERLADELVAHVRAWDRAGRPGRGLRVDVYPKPGPGGGVVLVKRHHEFVLSWPVVKR